MEDDDLDAMMAAWKRYVAEASTAKLKQIHAMPSQAMPTLSAITANAVLLDGVGRTREMWLPDFRREYLVPMPTGMLATWNPSPATAPVRFKVARFQLSSVTDGKAVYRLAGVE